jgi:polyisoprenoid-binding protein YceI
VLHEGKGMMLKTTAVMAALLIAAAGIAQPADKPAEAKPAETKPDTKQPEKQAEAPKAPVRAASGKSLVIPEDQKKLGTVYQTITLGSQKQVTFTSKTHNATFDGYSASVLGYAVAGPADNPADLKAGAWVLPVKSLETGNKTKNRNIAKAEWLDAGKSPDIIFTLKSVKDITPHKAGAGTAVSYKVTLVGDMTMRGVTKEVSIKDVVLGFVKETEKSAKIAKGDLLAIRCKYTVKLTDFGVTNDYVVKDKSVADEIEIDQSLTLATAAPEEQPASAAKPEEKPAEKPE